MTDAAGAHPPGADRPLVRKVASQGVLLMSGYAVGQALSLARNAIIGHWLSPADFGIAATLTLMLMVFEQLSDVGIDRLAVQAPDGEARFLDTMHLALVLRGILTALVLYLLAAPVAKFFGIAAAQSAFVAVAFAPLIRGFMHLGWRRAQRNLDNRPGLIIEVVPQAAALALTLPALLLAKDYSAVVWIAAAQAGAAVVASHLVAREPYRFQADRDVLARLLSFGWPIMLSALPVIAVLQGDRILVGRFYGMEALAAYSVAFLITSVPCLLAFRVGQALMLPLFSEVLEQKEPFRARFTSLTEATVLASALYLVAFVIAGGELLPVVVGAHYQGLDELVACLALMWTLRIVQVVPNIALMAAGTTRPLFLAGLIRASALTYAFGAAATGRGVIGIAIAGVIGEIASLIYLALRVESEREGLGLALVTRAALLIPVCYAAHAVHDFLPSGTGVITATAAALLATGCLLGAAAVSMPNLRGLLMSAQAKSL
jgi:O-antigen/teichoic acid export membrane protein